MSLRPPLAFNARPRRLSTPTDAFELHPDNRSYGTALRGKTRFVTDTLANVRPTPDTLLVSVHACGSLTDYVLDLAIEGRSPVAVVPCCHRVGAKALRDAGADAWDWVCLLYTSPSPRD